MSDSFGSLAQVSGSFDDLDDETYEKTVKAAQSSFALMKYDKESDTSVVLCRPETVRMPPVVQDASLLRL